MENSEQKGLLEDLILEMMEVNQNMVLSDKKLTMSNDYLNNINSNSWASFEQLHIIANILSENKLADLEKAKEDGALQQRMINALEGIKDNTKEQKKAKELDMNVGIGGLAAFALGFMKGYVEQFVKTAKAFFGFTKAIVLAYKNIIVKAFDWISESKFGRFIQGKIAGFLVGLSMQFDLLMDSIKNLYKDSRLERMVLATKDFFTSIVSKFKELKAVFMESNLIVAVRELWTDAKSMIMKPFQAIASFIKEGRLAQAADFIVDVYKRLIDPIFGLGDRLNDVKGFFVAIYDTVGGWVKNIFDKVKDVLGVLGGGDSVLAKIGKFFGKFLAPVTFLFTLWDTVKGAIEGYEKGGILGAVKGALAGLLSSLIAEPLNMLKGLVSWIAEKLGFEKFAAALDGFDFVQLVKNGVSAIYDWFKLAFTDPGEALSTLWNNLVGEGGLMDLLFKPVDLFIDWITKKLGFREESAPKFSMGNLVRTVWNTIIDWVASLVEAVPLVGKKGADAIRALTAGQATMDVGAAATPSQAETPRRAANTSGDQLNNAAAEKRNTETVAAASNDAALRIAASGGGAGGGGGTNASVSTSSSNVTINNGHMPDRTDWSVMSGSFGLAI